jgi:hypothetical protein
MNNAAVSWLKLLGIIIALLVFYFLMTCKSEERINDKMHLSSYVFSRLTASSVEGFKDDGIMHGPKYYYFQSTKKDIARLVEWLRLHRQEEVPEILSSSVKYTKEKTNWRFNWDHLEVFSIYYCAGNMIDWGFDLLLADGDNRVIYVTSGYISNLSNPAIDFQHCKKSEQ